LVQHSISSSNDEIAKDILDKAFNEFEQRFDPLYGGFNNAPKFPTPHNFYFLLRYWKRTGSSNALEMVEKTLTEMRKGGIYDHIGFGFHRYSTDTEWLVPHFEKMLYDQALLAAAYTETYLATKNNLYKRTAEEILEYVSRDMTSPDGGFYSAEDADSEGVEGKFYLWTQGEIKNLLNEDTDIFIKSYNVNKNGNWTDPVHESSDATNIIYLEKSYDELADELNISADMLEQKLEIFRELLFHYREKRIHPYKDDKILTDWNSLMISAYAKASQAFDESKYTAAAEKAARFILDKLRKKDGRLLHRFRDGDAGLPAHVDDYAFFIAALIDLYETTFNPEYLKTALMLNDDLILHFWDEKNSAFFFIANDTEELIARQKDIYDGALPSGNSVAILNLLRLSGLTGNLYLKEKAYGIIRAFAKNINTSPSAFSHALTAIDFTVGPAYEIVITGKKAEPVTIDMISFLRQNFLPNKVIILNDPDSSSILKEISPFSTGHKTDDNMTAAVVCENFRCNLPVSSRSDLEKLLSK